MIDIITGYAAYNAAVAGAALVTLAAPRMYARLPARWLCEFDELPGELHMPGMRGARSPRAAFLMRAGVFAAAVCAFAAAGLSVCMFAALLALAVAALSDADYMIIPDQLLLVMAAAALLMACGRGGLCAGFANETGGTALAVLTGGGTASAAAGGLTAAAAGAASSGGLMLLASAASAVFYSGSVGFGDVKMMAVCGALTGAPAAAVFMFTATMLGSAIFISAGLLTGRLRNGAFVPMAPFIALATAICM